jgi:ubiquitin C-terminal hydrolase
MISGNNNKEIGQIIKLNESSYTGKIIDIKSINPKTIKEFFKNPPLIGLDNIGATCYMNATLQCFCNILKFVDYFKYNKHLTEKYKEDKKKLALLSSFKLLIEELWPNENKKNIKSIPPKEFKKKISEMNPSFEGIAINDANDLITFLIMSLHSELNNSKNDNIINNEINDDPTNKGLMLQIFYNDFIAGNMSIISDLFIGLNYNITQCGNCSIKSYNFETYFF